MDVRFDDSDLERLETDDSFTAGFGAPVVKAFRKRLQFIRGATDERDIRAWRSLHFEQLVGDREGQSSIRLNLQFRLIVVLEGEAPSKTIAICEIADYH